MELNALTRWESIGKDLYARGKLGSEIERIKQFSKMLSAARKKQRQSGRAEQRSSQQPMEQQPDRERGQLDESKLSDIVESKDESENEVDGDEHLNDVSPLPLLDAIEAAEARAANVQEERMQDEIEEKELDSIPPTHARVSTLQTLYTALAASTTLSQSKRVSWQYC